MNVKKQNRVMILDLTIYNLRMFNWENNPPLNKINVTGTEDIPNSGPTILESSLHCEEVVTNRRAAPTTFVEILL